ncbi:ABC transporter permease [Paenibacillus arenosi]|uniref:ABC transporter permease n=1 Tax=Paenibacillus arenosi TaxID=2774142 RepID=A0ABR9B1T3_9BACL|nr:ABC transporter permease [Paenibacillus arenosi]MBD8499943.1 ABC transporter permease [Paenibacillus arenosi]
MTFRQFAFRNIVRNKRVYVAHFLSSSFSVMIFFIYALLLFHPNLQGELASTSITISKLGMMAMKASQYIIFTFSFFFCMYSVSAFLKARKREFGILMVQGMSPKQLHQLLFMENMMIGIASIIVGIVTGVVFSKLILLVSASVLFIRNGLPFYLPWQAVSLTALAFIVMFLVVSLLTSRLVKTNQLIELIRSADKPKPEPKASVWLALLSIVLIVAGYASVFYFALREQSPYILLACVILTVTGTYFLFTQLSVYVLRLLRSRRGLLLRKTNLLVLSELGYRMRDNAVMFFMVAVVTAVSFTGIGTSFALLNPGLAAMENPYAFTYSSHNNNTFEAKHWKMIEQELEQAGFAYESAKITAINTTDGQALLKLSDYNRLAEMLGYPTESLSDPNEVILSPSRVSQQTQFKQKIMIPETVTIGHMDWKYDMKVKKAATAIVYTHNEHVIVVPDDLLERGLHGEGVNAYTPTYIQFVVKDWEYSQDVAQRIEASLQKDYNNREYMFYFESLVTHWLTSKQENGIVLMVSVLIGIVFFTFAASFLYFRLYTDLDRDRQHYNMIAKVGLSRKEMGRVVTVQFMFMFFLPFLIAVIHSSVAFMALQQLVSYSVLQASILIFISFAAVQFAYFIGIRWRYLRNLTRAM